jgi:hypothetical protein
MLVQVYVNVSWFMSICIRVGICLCECILVHFYTRVCILVHMCKYGIGYIVYISVNIQIYIQHIMVVVASVSQCIENHTHKTGLIAILLGLHF